MSKGKQKFEVLENESINDCLERMKEAGYMAIKRTEKPIFKEVKTGGNVTYEPAGRQIIFEGIQMSE